MRDRDGRNLLLTPFLFIFRRVLQAVVRLGLVTLVPMLRIVMMIGILVRIIRTVANSVVITASKHSSS